jgi:O-antigen/teichoic acid export membrane protein
VKKVSHKKGSVVRLFTIAAHAFNKLSTPAFNIVISVIIIRTFSDELWGQFISLSLISNLAIQVISWGHKEYLIKGFSQNSRNIANLWQQSFISRGVLYLVCIPVFIFFLTLPRDLIIGLSLWTFTLYIYRSFDVLVLYFRNFILSTILEFFGYVILIVGIIVLRSDFSIIHLLWLNIAITLFKSVCIIVFYRKTIFKNVKLNPNILFFREAFPFFLPSIIGFVQSKADIYVVALSLSQNELAEYQILINLLSMIHQIALLSITPYTKHMYRLNDEVTNRFAWMFFKWGLVVSLLSMPVIYFIITFYYRFKLEWSVYLGGLLLVLPLFYYSIKTYQWFKHNDQYKVVAINLLMAVVGLLLSLALIPSWGITGALVANCATQWLAFFLFLKKSKKKGLYEQPRIA